MRKNALQDYLNHPSAVNKVDERLKGCRLRTTYLTKTGERKEIKYGTISLKSAMEQHAYEGYLNVTVQQHYYCRHRIRLMYPRLKCVAEPGKSGHYKYYPLELLEIITSEDIYTPTDYNWPCSIDNNKPFDSISSIKHSPWYNS